MDSFLDEFLRYLRFQKAIKYLPKNSIVCDIGCGPAGHFLKSIEPLIKYGFGFDKEAKIYKNSKIEIKKFKILNSIPLDSEVVDVITILAVLEHLKNPQAILNESFRILENNGRLILTSPTPWAKPLLGFLARLNLIDKVQIKEHKNYFHPIAIKKMLLRAGFKGENIESKYFEFGFNSLIIAKKIV